MPELTRTEPTSPCKSFPNPTGENKKGNKAIKRTASRTNGRVHVSLVTKLKPRVNDLKVHKRPSDMTSTERRLSQMSAIILNPRFSKEQKDKMLKEIVAESQVEKVLKQKGIRV